MQSQRIEVIPTSLDPTHRVFEIVSEDGTDDIRPTNQLAKFRVADAKTFYMGERYF